jgi:hypothetical protein
MLVQSGEFNGAPLPAKLDVGSLRCNCGQKLRHYYKDIFVNNLRAAIHNMGRFNRIWITTDVKCNNDST